MALKRKNIFAKSTKPRCCMFCVRQDKYVDYKDLRRILKYISNFNRILPRRYTGSCLKHQKLLSNAVKRARLMGLLPFTTEHKQVRIDK